MACKRCDVWPMKTRTMDLVSEQLARSRQKYPGNEHMLTAILESLGTLARALLCGASIETREKEAAQVIAITVRLIEEGDATFTGWQQRRPAE